MMSVLLGTSLSERSHVHLAGLAKSRGHSGPNPDDFRPPFGREKGGNIENLELPSRPSGDVHGSREPATSSLEDEASLKRVSAAGAKAYLSEAYWDCSSAKARADAKNASTQRESMEPAAHGSSRGWNWDSNNAAAAPATSALSSSTRHAGKKKLRPFSLVDIDGFTELVVEVPETGIIQDVLEGAASVILGRMGRQEMAPQAAPTRSRLQRLAGMLDLVSDVEAPPGRMQDRVVFSRNLSVKACHFKGRLRVHFRRVMAQEDPPHVDGEDTDLEDIFDDSIQLSDPVRFLFHARTYDTIYFALAARALEDRDFTLREPNNSDTVVSCNSGYNRNYSSFSLLIELARKAHRRQHAVLSVLREAVNRSYHSLQGPALLLATLSHLCHRDTKHGETILHALLRPHAVHSENEADPPPHDPGGIDETNNGATGNAHYAREDTACVVEALELLESAVQTLTERLFLDNSERDEAQGFREKVAKHVCFLLLAIVPSPATSRAANEQGRTVGIEEMKRGSEDLMTGLEERLVEEELSLMVATGVATGQVRGARGNDTDEDHDTSSVESRRHVVTRNTAGSLLMLFLIAARDRYQVTCLHVAARQHSAFFRAVWKTLGENSKCLSRDRALQRQVPQ
ncbi:unnamed protein product, partial [Amoebophrya sp. A25]|eukprot:GSA25T00000184001.1